MAKKKRIKPASRRKAAKKTAPARKPLSQLLKANWLDRYPVLRFGLLFGGIIALLYLLMATPFYKTHLQPGIFNVNAWLGGLLLNLLGQGVEVSGDQITNDRFSIGIRQGCDALEGITIFLAALVAFPTRWKYKLKGLAVGIPALLGVNLIRIVSLFLVGVYAESWFDFIHVELWQYLFILISVAACALWISWTFKQQRLAHAQVPAE